MKKFFSLVALALLMLSYSCKDEDENGTEIPNPAKAQIEAITNVLKDEPQMGAFTEALKQLDVANVEGTEFTLFGVNDAALSADPKKAAASISQNDLKRHMASGKFDLEKLKSLKKIKVLSGDTLNITVEGNSVAINGIVIDSVKTIGNNIILYIHKLIPVKPVERTVVFEVFSCNEQWSVQNSAEASIAKEATIKIYNDANATLVKTLATDTAGKAAFNPITGLAYYYTVEKGNQKGLYKNYIVGGMITSQAEAEAIQTTYPTGWNKLPGGLQLLDVNSDGIIDGKDKTEKRYVNEDTIKTFIVSDSFVWPTEAAKVDSISQENMWECEWLYRNAYNNFTKIDENYSTDSVRKRITPSDKLLDSLWTNSYSAIKTINKYLELKGAENQTQKTYRGNLMLLRGSLHLNLSILFGDVPYLKLSDANPNTMSKSSISDVYKFAREDFNSATEYLIGEKKANAISKSALTYLMQKNYRSALDKVENILNAGTINSNTNRELYLKTIYYKLEALIELGSLADARATLSLFESITTGGSQSTGLSIDQLRAESKYILNKYTIGLYYGITYANITRWGENASWEKRKLMPIPQNAINNSGGVLAQNPGW